MKALILGLVLAILAGGAFASWRAYRFMNVPPESPGQEKTVLIEPGMTFAQIALALRRENVISSQLGFKILARVTEQGNKVKAGEYLLSTGLTPEKVLDLLVSGQAILYKVSVPEGLTMRQIAKLVEAAGLGSPESFERAASDQELLAKYHIPAQEAEGFLFPETYKFTRKPGNDARQVVEAMLRQFNRKIREAWNQDPPQGQELYQAVILASIVEKETAKPEERPRVAGVFMNRLAKKMLLQTDPTIIYGLGDQYDGNLHRAQIDDAKNPYNTYQHPGLPPGPICNPGLESLKAVAAPENNDLYYFVATGDGGHHFSKTLEEHNQAVAKYQLHKPRPAPGN